MFNVVVSYMFKVAIYKFLIPLKKDCAVQGKYCVIVNATGCGFIFALSRSGNKAKRGVEFCRSRRNASRIWLKTGTEYLKTRFPDTLCLPWYGREANNERIEKTEI